MKQLKLISSRNRRGTHQTRSRSGSSSISGSILTSGPAWRSRRGSRRSRSRNSRARIWGISWRNRRGNRRSRSRIRICPTSAMRMVESCPWSLVHSSWLVAARGGVQICPLVLSVILVCTMQILLNPRVLFNPIHRKLENEHMIHTWPLPGVVFVMILRLASTLNTGTLRGSNGPVPMLAIT